MSFLASWIFSFLLFEMDILLYFPVAFIIGLEEISSMHRYLLNSGGSGVYISV